jgi:hypothetical protein
LCLNLELYYKRRKYRHKTRELNNQLGLEYVQDIRRLFVDNSSFLTQNQMVSPWLTDCYKPFDFTNIAGQPHDLPTSLEKMLVFHGDNAIGAKEHWDAFMDYVRSLGIAHLDVLYKCFSLSLKKDARNWFLGLPDNSINSLDACRNAFFDRWLERKDSRFLLNALTNIKRNENEIVDEFNLRFDKIVQDIPQTHQPNPTSILLYYLNSFQGQFNFFLNEANPNDLMEAKKKIRVWMTIGLYQGKPDILNPPRAKDDPKPKVFHSTKPSPDPFTAILEGMKRLEMNFTQTMSTLQNRLVQLREINNKTSFLLEMGIGALLQVKDLPQHWIQPICFEHECLTIVKLVMVSMMKNLCQVH